MAKWLPHKNNGETENIPRHVAIIMDGNGRWAKDRGFPRLMGHRAGMKTVKAITRAAAEMGVQVLTLYAFSTENWNRPKEEVNYLMGLPQEFIKSELRELIENHVKVTMMGDMLGLPPHTLTAVQEAIEKTKHNTGMILNFALNYGGRSELVQTFRKIAGQIQSGQLALDDVNEEAISSFLYSAPYGDPDLLIRTSGEKRLSNFMLWQIAYTELCFVDAYWPSFTVEHFQQAIRDYSRRVRRYGSI